MPLNIPSPGYTPRPNGLEYPYTQSPSTEGTVDFSTSTTNPDLSVEAQVTLDDPNGNPNPETLRIVPPMRGDANQGHIVGKSYVDNIYFASNKILRFF